MPSPTPGPVQLGELPRGCPVQLHTLWLPAGAGLAFQAATGTPTKVSSVSHLLLPWGTKAGEMSVGCHRNCSGCSGGNVTLRAAERSPLR